MNWTDEWPTEPGHYWLYGWCFRDRDDPADFYHVEVAKTMNSIAYITNGHFLYEMEGGEGIWHPIIFPELPQEVQS